MRSTIPVIVHNYLDQAKQVQVSLDIKGLDLVKRRAALDHRPQQRRRNGDVAAQSIAHRRRHISLPKLITNEESDALELDFPRRAHRRPAHPQ